jgi:hypothetical protein
MIDSQILWTWQGYDFNPLLHCVDRTKSEFWVHNSCPDIRRAYEELDDLLSLPKEKKEQYVWCYEKIAILCFCRWLRDI